MKCPVCAGPMEVLLHLPRCASAGCRNFDARFAEERARLDRALDLATENREWYADRERTHGPI